MHSFKLVIAQSSVYLHCDNFVISLIFRHIGNVEMFCEDGNDVLDVLHGDADVEDGATAIRRGVGGSDLQQV